MQTELTTHTKIDPFEFQNRSVYRDLLRLSSNIRELQNESKTDLEKMFLSDLFHVIFSVSKDIAYVSISEDPMLKMQLYASSITKTFDCITALDICFEARWIPSLQYFEAKQILEKAYWNFKEEQKVIMKMVGVKFYKSSTANAKEYQ